MKDSKITLRMGSDNITISTPQGDNEIFEMNASISVAANLRKAFTTSPLLQGGYEEVQAQVATPVMLVPIEEAPQESELPVLYRHTFTDVPSTDNIVNTRLDDLSVIALYAVNKDIHTVLADHFDKVAFVPIGLDVWREAYSRSFSPVGNTMHAFFHDEQMEVFSFRQNRFIFHNTFRAVHAHDALYYLLFTWKQLAMDIHHDRLELIGDMPHEEWLTQHLLQYLDTVVVHKS